MVSYPECKLLQHLFVLSCKWQLLNLGVSFLDCITKIFIAINVKRHINLNIIHSENKNFCTTFLRCN